MTASKIEVSVIIPCFNCERTIITCLDSVLSQQFKDYEVIIVDDGSTDRSCDLITDYVRSLDAAATLKLYRQENAGPSAARNRAVNLSKGTWVAFLDSDDYWAPDKLRIQMKCIEEHPELSLLGVRAQRLSSESKDLYTPMSFNQMLFSNQLKTSGVLLKREVALQFLFDEKMKYSEDYRLWLLVAFHYEIGIINKVLCGSILNKHVFGDSGLSGNLLAMQKGELSNYRYLYDCGYLNLRKYFECISYSSLKYLRRLVISHKHGWRKKKSD
jgi:glycosyltransferase involved in cell wall biosynthesis